MACYRLPLRSDKCNVALKAGLTYADTVVLDFNLLSEEHVLLYTLKHSGCMMFTLNIKNISVSSCKYLFSFKVLPKYIHLLLEKSKDKMGLGDNIRICNFQCIFFSSDEPIVIDVHSLHSNI